MEKNFLREDFLLLAKMAQQTERYQDMLDYIGKFIRSEVELNTEERSIVSAAYKNVVGNKRAELRVLQAIEQKENRKANETHVLYINNYRETIEKELKALCDEILNIIDKYLIPNTKSAVDSKVFYLKMKGDYNRYLTEFLTIDQEYNDSVEKALDAYKEADNLARNNLATTNPIRLGLQLNLSVFYYEILKKPEEAKQIANNAFEEAIANIDNVNQENYKDCTLIMQLLRDNITLWSNDVQIDEQAEENS